MWLPWPPTRNCCIHITRRRQQRVFLLVSLIAVSGLYAQPAADTRPSRWVELFEGFLNHLAELNGPAQQAAQELIDAARPGRH